MLHNSLQHHLHHWDYNHNNIYNIIVSTQWRQYRMLFINNMKTLNLVENNWDITFIIFWQASYMMALTALLLSMSKRNLHKILPFGTKKLTEKFKLQIKTSLHTYLWFSWCVLLTFHRELKKKKLTEICFTACKTAAYL